MLDKRIDLSLIRDRYGCDSCKHHDNGIGDHYCDFCNVDLYPPSQYQPARHTVQEKAWNGEVESITYQEYKNFLKEEKIEEY